MTNLVQHGDNVALSWTKSDQKSESPSKRLAEFKKERMCHCHPPHDFLRCLTSNKRNGGKRLNKLRRLRSHLGAPTESVTTVSRLGATSKA